MIRIINNNLLVINDGISAGLTITSTFTIRKLIPIKDPNAGNIDLGDLEVVFATATVVDIQTSFATLKLSTLTKPLAVSADLWTPDETIDTDCIARED